MRIFAQNEPLAETELERLEEFLRSCKGGKAMNIEELDGFFAALIAGPEVVLPSEYLPEVCGGEMSDTCEVASLDEATDILALLMRHWNDIAHTLGKDEVYVPLLLEDENGVTPGNDWACGFLRGVDLRHDGWKTLIADEDHAPQADPPGAARKDHRLYGGRAVGRVSVFQTARTVLCKRPRARASAR